MSSSQLSTPDSRWRERSCLLRRISASTVIGALITTTSCNPRSKPEPSSIAILGAPAAATGGPDTMQPISGRVAGAKSDQQVVLYAHSGVWWIQPFANQPFTRIRSDGTWSTTTHLGTEYAAFLVDREYRPEAKLSALPTAADGVQAIAVQQGKAAPPDTGHLLRFSGYDWAVRTVESDHGGDTYAYDPGNAWVDSKGYLHLRMQQRGGRWTCGEVILTRSLGYGTYRFVVQDGGALSTSAVLGMYTWDDTSAEQAHREVDIELSRWGEPDNANAQYAVQPFFLPANLYRFQAPNRVVTHQFRWQPQSVTFSSFRGVHGGKTALDQHVFTAHVKTPGQETTRISLYDFHHTTHSSTKPVEIVIQSFTHFP